jgi:transketolase
LPGAGHNPPRRRGRLTGFLPGIAIPGGITNQAIEAISVMFSPPIKAGEMRVLSEGSDVLVVTAGITSGQSNMASNPWKITSLRAGSAALWPKPWPVQAWAKA